ncbi:30S ribosomal protein S13 [Candidatus Microgenomates bacterium]|nr:30S ribosomal protein S13 [Candidatus Microgenomates bacterium]
MARIAGITVPDGKRVEIGLTYIYGIGHTSAQKILTATKINPDTRVKDLTEAELGKIRTEITAHFQVEGDLGQAIRLNVNRLKEINSYRGLRHRANLPAHGQRTRTNARTKRGKRLTVGSGRKKAPTPT